MTTIQPLAIFGFIGDVKVSVDHFLAAVKKFTAKDIDQSNLLEVRKTNDKLMLLERYFIDRMGLPDQPETKYVTIINTSLHLTH